MHEAVAGGAGLCPAGAEGRELQWATQKEGARGGTMGSPTPKREVEGRPLYSIEREL
jgi:hypothetical protein